MDKIEDAVTPWVHAGNQVRPGYRALRGDARFERKKTAARGERSKVGHFPSVHETLQQFWIHTVDTQNEELLFLYGRLGAVLARQRQAQQGAEQSCDTKCNHPNVESFHLLQSSWRGHSRCGRRVSKGAMAARPSTPRCHCLECSQPNGLPNRSLSTPAPSLVTNAGACYYTISIKAMQMIFLVRRWICSTSRLVLPLIFVVFLPRGFAQIPSTSTDRALKQAQQAFEQGDFAGAVRSFEQVRGAAPERKEAWHSLVLCYLRLGETARALELAREALSRWPDDGETHHVVGFAYFQNGQLEPAIQELLQATRLMPNRYEPQLDLALAYLSTKQYLAASESLEVVVRLKPELPLQHILLGRAYLNTNRTIPAIREFNKALSIDPRIPLGHYHLGYAYESLGRNPEAIAEFRKELTLHRDNAEVYYRMGRALLGSGHTQEAAVQLRQSVRLAPKNADAQCALGKAFLELGRPLESIEALQRAVALNSDDPSPFFLLARAYGKVQKPEESAKALQQFVELKKRQRESGGMAYRPH